MISIAPLRTSASTISSACSPVSGWEIRRSSIFTPSFRAYSGSRACSASINAAIPPAFCASAIMWSVTVVLPEDSGPYTSIIRPRGIPPTPSAMSRGRIPVEMTSIFIFALASPRRIIDPFPCVFSICLSAFSRASSRAVLLSFSAILSAPSQSFIFFSIIRKSPLFCQRNMRGFLTVGRIYYFKSE